MLTEQRSLSDHSPLDNSLLDKGTSPVFTIEVAEELINFDPAPPDGLLPAPEFITGTDGDDRLIGTENNDGIEGLAGNDVLLGRGGTDVMLGDAGRDRLQGGRGLDLLFGNAGRDTLVGNAGRDYLDGGAGNDRMIGGRGADQFVLRVNKGRDWIQDFTDGEDGLILFDNIPLEDLEIVQQGQNTVIQYESQALAVLVNVDANLITTEDFGVPLIAVI
ncbi:MAG: calcium-binding protein [Cyanobacteria bacterium J06638_22]